MPDPALALARMTTARRLSLVLLVAVFMLGSLTVSQSPSVVAGAPAQREQLRFMWAMAGQESGGDYYARNRSSGAYGKYQIMPFNWPVWAAEYLDDGRADQTPFNQERVAYGKLRDLYRWLGSWKRVAYWWLTGRTDTNEKKWSSYARGYVTNIMRLRKKAPSGASARPARTPSRATRGDWRRSGSAQKLRLRIGGKTWPRGGRLKDGEVLKVSASKRAVNGERWIAVVTADGRLGWLKQWRTLPARRPSTPGRWRDIKERGVKAARRDRSLVRPRPR